MRAQVRGRALELVQAIGAQQPLEEGHHGARIEAGALEQREAHAIGLALVIAGVVDLVLDLQRAGRGDRGLGDLPALRTTAAGGEDGERQGRQRSPLRAALPVQHARLVALQHVRGLVREHARQLGFALREQDERGVHADVPAGEREGVDRIVLHHEVVDLARRFVGDRQQARAERGDVVCDFGVVEVGGIDTNVPHDAVADCALLRIGERGGRGVAEIGKGLGERRLPMETEQQRGYEGAGFHGWGAAANCYYGIMKEKLTHFDERGAARMVDVGSKAETRRVAVATGTIRMRPPPSRSGTAKKGDVLGVARVAASGGQCVELIRFAIRWRSPRSRWIQARQEERVIECRATWNAPRATASRWRPSWPCTSALTIYDMCKAVAG